MRSPALLCLTLAALAGAALAARPWTTPSLAAVAADRFDASASGPYSFKTVPTTYTLDHFDFRPHSPGNITSFESKYLINDTWWKPGQGPIFFYTGNEGPIELFAQNTGFMWDIAPEFNALLVFAEHRYYGTSMPFGSETFADPKSGTLQWLTSEQALADYADLIQHLKATIPGAADAPVVAFGGSYGGMLSSWFRMKYPGVVAGSIAASAPIWQFTGLAPPQAYCKVTTNTFTSASADCSAGIQLAWQRMAALAKTSTGLSTLTDLLSPCSPLSSEEEVTTSLFNFFNSAIQYMAMADYPVPASFLGPMPAWPVNVSCAAFDIANPTDTQLLKSMRIVANVFYNYTGEAGSCFNISQAGPSTLGSLGGWDYQSCTEMVMPIGQYGPPNDMFYLAPWNLSDIISGCQSTYGLTPRPEWIKTVYNGEHLQGVSNIVFTNGNLDPWSGGGVTHNITGSNIVAYSIHLGAHHLDLRSATSSDPPSVIEARNIHRMHIRNWIKEYNASK